MNGIIEMISTLCPDGVEYKELKDVLKIRNGSDYKKFGNGDYPVYGSGGIMTYIDHYVYDKPSVLIPRKGSIDKLYYVESPFWNVDTVFYTEIDTEQVLPKYVYYCLVKEHLERLNTAGGVPSLTQKVLNKVQIPVPPIDMQKEIIRVLDEIGLVMNDLTMTLQDEVDNRKKQYTHYCNQLFVNNSHAKWVDLSTIADIGTGSSNTNEAEENGEYPFYVRSQEPLRKNTYEYDETAIITAGDGVGVGKVFHFVEGKYALHQRAYRIHIKTDDVLPKYCFYYIKNAFYEYITQNMYQGSVASIRRPMLNKFQVPVVPLEEQLSIIDKYDRLEENWMSIIDELKKEIEARQNQYEYYRDKLLTFKKAV